MNEHFFELRKLYSVEFALKESPFLFQFKLRHNMLGHIFIILDENSKVLPYLNEWMIIEMNYYRVDSEYPEKSLTQIVYIKRDNPKEFEGYYMVELKLLGHEGTHSGMPE